MKFKLVILIILSCFILAGCSSTSYPSDVDVDSSDNIRWME